MKAIKNVKIIKGGAILPETVLLYDDTVLGFATEVPAGAEVTDGEGAYLSAGFIDQHIHGYIGEDAMTHTPDHIRAGLPANGVTAYLPTTMTQSKEAIDQAMNWVREAMKKEEGARVLGCHMEGPFINAAKKGAQPGEYIIPPAIEMVETYKDVIKLVTYAPEQDEDHAFVKALRKMNIVPSVGHTSANFETAKAAYDNGALSTTHFFNAMPPLHHRDPGVIGAALAGDAYIELIADTIHVNPNLFSILAKLKPNRLCLITDCMEAGGLPNGEYALGGQPVFVKDGFCTLEDGTLAGSVLKLNVAIRNMAKYGGVTLAQAVSFATENPARLLGVDDRMGTLNVGTLADFVLMDEACNVKSTYMGGKCVYAGN